MLDQITPLILTYNEAPNIGRTLRRLTWARRIVIVDSGSSDETIDIVAGYPQVEVIFHPFVDFATQCNFGLAQIASPWVLSLDADYELSDGLIAELRSLSPPEHVSGYRANFVYRVNGKALRGSLYPPRVVLYRRHTGSYRQAGHGHQVAIAGDVEPLSAPIYHDDRKPLARWLASQQRYARNEADYLLARHSKPLPWIDRLRLAAWPAPIAALFYTLLLKRCLLDGWPGWLYALQRMLAETMLAVEIIDRRLRPANGSVPAETIPPAEPAPCLPAGIQPYAARVQGHSTEQRLPDPESRL